LISLGFSAGVREGDVSKSSRIDCCKLIRWRRGGVFESLLGMVSR
jgi:hypothetical protein